MLGAALAAGLLAATTAAAGGMDAADLRALERLKGANPHACAKLRSWGAAGVDPCAWPGVTCTAADGDAARRVQVVDLRYCGLTSLPADALVMDKLEVLEVRGNAIATLPPTVGHLTSLQRIMIEFNELTELPKEICMPQLQRLYIAYNKLTSLPDCIGEITALNDIWLRGNSIATIPDSFCKLRQHISGYMMMAGIQHLPDCIGDVPFSVLYLYGNELSELPDSMQQIYAAHDGFELSLADNQLTALPAWVATTPQIWSINVEGNRLTSLPTALPPHLTSLRLGGNPIVNVSNAALVSLLQAAPDLDTFSLRYAPPGLTHNPGWMDPNSYVVKTMPTAGGIATCPSSLDPHADASCPFIIRAQQPPPPVGPAAVVACCRCCRRWSLLTWACAGRDNGYRCVFRQALQRRAGAALLPQPHARGGRLRLRAQRPTPARRLRAAHRPPRRQLLRRHRRPHRRRRAHRQLPVLPTLRGRLPQLGAGGGGDRLLGGRHGVRGEQGRPDVPIARRELLQGCEVQARLHRPR